MGNGLIAAKARRNRNKNANTTDKWVGKKFTVERGDLVKFHTPNPHHFGGMGTVVGYLSKNVILVRTFGGLDSDYPPQIVEVRNQAANPNYNGPDFQAHYNNYIEKIVWRVAGKKPKKKRPAVKFYEVTPTVLPSVLSGEHEVPTGHKVVLVPEPEGTNEPELSPDGPA
jgi:hypothetical protein